MRVCVYIFPCGGGGGSFGSGEHVLVFVCMAVRGWTLNVDVDMAYAVHVGVLVATVCAVVTRTSKLKKRASDCSRLEAVKSLRHPR